MTFLSNRFVTEMSQMHINSTCRTSWYD